MANHDADLNQLESQFIGLEGSMSGVGSVAASFRRELDGMQGSLKDTGREATSMSRSVSSSFTKAFEGVLFGGQKLSDALAGVGKSISGSVLTQALAPVQKSVGSAVSSGLQSMLGGLLGFSHGAAFRGGRVSAFARGGVVDQPTNFPMRGGTGLMGEAGPEAIMPLARGADGRLGVRTNGAAGGAVHVTMNISAPDAASFQRSQTQVAAEMTRAIQRGRRNL
ncbi:MAG: phage tail tape measure protein [Amaricoccus sp.]